MKIIRGILITGMVAIGLCLAPPSWADDFADYKTGAGATAEVDLPMVAGGWFTAAEYFPDGTTEMIDDQFEAEGRIIAANNKSIYLQRTYGSSQWDVVGTVPDVMDPSFIHVSPDGSKIALGRGYNQPLLIVPTSVLSASNPPDLTTAAGVKQFENVNYYEGDWADNQYFVIDGGAWPGPDCTYPYYDDPECVFTSGVGAIDTDTADPANHTGVLLTPHPGASADVEVTGSGDLLVGIGFATNPNRSGEIKVWDAADWDPTTPNSLDYDTNGRVVANNILSAAHMGQDAEGNLHIGGGDAFGTGGPSENGYAALVKSGIIDAIADGTRTTPVTDGDKVDNSEYKFFAPDSCQDDSATGALADHWGRGLAIMWNPSGDGAGGCAGGAGSATDYWLTGVIPRLTVYYPGSGVNLDDDGDGIPNAADNAYLTANPGQEDTDGDGYGNIVDADLDNDGTIGMTDAGVFRNRYGTADPDADFDSDGSVGMTDAGIFRNQYGKNAPYY